MKTLPILAAALVFALSTDARAQSKAWIVDVNAGPGSNFTQIQPAVNAASEGDLIRVRDGDYDAFTITAKSLTIIGQTSGTTVVRDGGSAIRELGPSQSCLVRHMGFISTGPPATVPEGLVVDSCLGSVWIEDCHVEGEPCPEGSCPSGDPTAFLARNSDAVVVVRTTMRGADNYLPGSRAATGVLLRSSSASLFDCLITGGTSFPVASQPTPPSGAPGGHACIVDSSFLFAQSTSFEGGHGGMGADPLNPWPCSNGGPGGDALRLEGTGTQAYMRAGFLAEGFDGFGGQGCTGNGDSVPLVVLGNAVFNPLVGELRALSAHSPVEALQDMTFLIEGQPGDEIYLFFSLVQQHTFFSNINSMFLVPAVPVFVPLGFLPPTGFVLFDVGTAPLPPGIDFINLYFQLAYLTPNGPPGMSSPAQVTWLAPGI